jgi:4-hydroxy-3-methylbut-2-enyl diphosphate reductase
MSASEPLPPLCCILAFNGNCQLAVRRVGAKVGLPFTGPDVATAAERLESAFAVHTQPLEHYTASADGRDYRVFFVQVNGEASDSAVQFLSLEKLSQDAGAMAPSLTGVLAGLDPFLIDIPYLHLGENDFIYKFRPEKERNTAIYAQDSEAANLYQSRLFGEIKNLTRRHERMAADPVLLDFGPIRYVIPSHFGFCLGVKNAIERAYETLAENPGKRVFMLSELIHNSFVNDDLLRRGLRYLQSDKGVPYTVIGQPASVAPPGTPLLWDSLTPDDVVIIPAFGATDEDKRRLVRKGLAVFPYDATCMLVEKVWKAARAYGRAGYTVVIHGKFEHEETKATFANTRRFAPAVIVRNLEEARILGEIVTTTDPAERQKFYSVFAGKYTSGFDVERDLQHIAVVNQTTLLMNETRDIINYFRELYASHFGPDRPDELARVGGGGRNDTLCYATQVNQDALARALDGPLDAALVIGGRNSSNTYQLYRLCAQRLGDRALFIQSEANILSPGEVEHYVFPSKGQSPQGYTERHPLWQDCGSAQPKRILITGGASCPDGVIQQVINRINRFFPADQLRTPEAVLADLEIEAVSRG